MNLSKRILTCAACCSGFLLAAKAGAQTPLVCGQIVSNSIAEIGERDVYVYSAAAGESIGIRMTAITSGLDARLELRDSTSNLLTSASGQLNRTLTEAGNYLIIASDQGGDEVGDYAITLQRLANPCGAVALDCPDVVEASIQSTGEVIAYTITVPPGGAWTTLRLESLTGSFTPRLELFDPSGVSVGSTFSALTVNLANSGNFTLLVSHYFGTSLTGDFRLATQRVVDPCAPIPVSCGTVTAGEIGMVGELDAFTITSPGGEAYALQLVSTNSAFHPVFDLYSPSGDSLTTSDTDHTGTFAEAGTYTVIVRSSSGTIRAGNYWLSVERVTNPCDASPLACGDTMAGNIDEIGQSDVYSVAGGDLVSLRLTGSTSGFLPIMRLYDSAGALMDSSTDKIEGELAPGNHTLLVSRYSGSSLTGQYSLTHLRLLDPCNATPLACGGLTSGSIDNEGELEVFTFEATAGDVAVLKLSSHTQNFNPTMELFDPAGNPITSSFGTTQFGGTLTNTGTHAVLVRYRFGSLHTGEYSLFLQNLTTPCGNVTSIPCGGLVSGLQAPETPVTCSFAGTAGDVVTVRFSTTTTPRQEWEIYEPDGSIVFPTGLSADWTLNQNGNHFVVVYPLTGEPQIADYAISLNKVKGACAAVPLICGALQAGAITDVGEIHAYTFTLVAGDLISLHVRSATEFFDPVFDLYDPDGMQVAELADSFVVTPASAKAGQYTALVHWKLGENSRVGEYRLDFQCSAQPIALETTMQGAFDQAGESVLYSFAANSGSLTICSDQIEVDPPPFADFAPFMALFAPSGELVADGSEVLVPTLDENGTYYLLLAASLDAPHHYLLHVAEGFVSCPEFAPLIVTMLQPAPGEFVGRGEQLVVGWSISAPNALARQEIWLSQDAGQTFTALATNLTGGARSYEWDVPAGASMGGWRLRVIAVDVAGQTGSDETQGDFFAINPPDQHGAAYNFDVLNHLVYASYAPGQAQQYAYDAALNRSQLFGTLDPNADTDGDGMLDTWEVAHDLDPFDPSDAAADDDGDGMNNYAESVACTNPHSAGSVFAINQVFRDDTETRISFLSRLGKTYFVEWTTNLESGWISLAPVTGELNTTTITNTSGSGGVVEFYRIRAEPGQPCD